MFLRQMSFLKRRICGIREGCDGIFADPQGSLSCRHAARTGTYPHRTVRSMASAQDCMIDYISQFAVEVEENVLYGTAERSDGVTDLLRMNIHRLVTVGDRPLLIAVHGGAFISGDRSDMDELCDRYAARGYVAASVSYRLGFHPPLGLPTLYAHDEAEVLRASYRAQQDVKGRYVSVDAMTWTTAVPERRVYGAARVASPVCMWPTPRRRKSVQPPLSLPPVGQSFNETTRAIAGALHVGEHSASESMRIKSAAVDGNYRIR